MAGFCEVCAKSTTIGRNIRHKHAGRWQRKAPRTPRFFKPNIQRHRFVLDGRSVQINICTSCLRTLMKIETV